MKNLKKIFSLVFIMLAAGFVFTACGIQKDVGISSITINSESSVIEIYEGEFNEAGITAKVVYDDETTETVTITEDMVSGYNDGPQWFDNPGTYAITVLFKDETVDLTVKVLPKYISVRFFDGHGNLIEKQSIRKGTDAVAPNDGFDIEGMEFIGWDRLFTNLTENTDVYAMYGNIKALDIETQLHDWQYRVKTDVIGNNVYEFFKFADGKVYYYDGKLENFLYSEKDSIEGVEYTAVYTSRIIDEISGSWKISFDTNINEKQYTLYYDGEKLYIKSTDDTLVYYKQANTKYALNGSWYKWTITAGENETADINGYIRIGSNAKIEYYKGASAPSENTSVDNLIGYSVSINDEGNIIITTEETSSVQSLIIVCNQSPYISNLDKMLTIVK